MKTHRGINFSTIAGEGLNGFPGFLIALFFLVPVVLGVLAAIAWVLDTALSAVGWRSGPIRGFLFDQHEGLVVPLVIAAACAVYLLSQWRDKQLTARVQRELHKLNEETNQGVAVPTTDEEIAEFARSWKGELGFGSFRAEELRSAARPSAMSPEAPLVAILTLFFIVGIVSVLVPMEFGETLAVGFVAVCVGGVIGYAGHCLRARRQERTIEHELEGSK